MQNTTAKENKVTQKLSKVKSLTVESAKLYNKAIHIKL